MHEDKTYSKIAEFVYLYIKEIYDKRGGLVLHRSRDFCHSSEIDRFEALHDSHGIYFLPKVAELSETQKVELKIWDRLQKLYGGRPIFVIIQRNDEWIISKAQLIAGYLTEGGG